MGPDAVNQEARFLRADGDDVIRKNGVAADSRFRPCATTERLSLAGLGENIAAETRNRSTTTSDVSANLFLAAITNDDRLRTPTNGRLSKGGAREAVRERFATNA